MNRSKLIVVIGVIASLITIFVFVFKIHSLDDLVNYFSSNDDDQEMSDMDKAIERQKAFVGLDTFVDFRDGKKYKYTSINGKIWFAQNLDYATRTGSWYYENERSNGLKSGRLYSWEEANKVCPEGWHLPSRKEWEELMIHVSSKYGYVKEYNHWNGVGKHLKAMEGWFKWSPEPTVDGTDDYNFRALPGGYRDKNGHFKNENVACRWWTSTESSFDDLAYYIGLHYRNNTAVDQVSSVKEGFCVRCIKDRD